MNANGVTHASDTQASLLRHPHDIPVDGWQHEAAAAFSARMLSEESLFPCIFGVTAVRKGTVRYSFIPAGEARVATLAAALTEFTSIAATLGNRTSLICFFDFQAGVETLDEHRDHFWALLSDLSAIDPSEWPPGISQNPEDSTWEFSFNSTPMFVVANTPRHVARRSRKSRYLTITFQPRFVFDDLKAGTPTGDKARAVIRRRLDSYDSVERTPLLGSFGEPGNVEWSQYFLNDDNAPADLAAGCPMRHARSAGAG
ncbi:MAG TPA: YqcI/YcgG family protein [Jatrophihabitans sp.]|uniref:YqcI/YcgG family protein n=1 Tax=Jatrophihabitans sp. TaxID=1932789 RepID=UPI002F1EDEF3